MLADAEATLLRALEQQWRLWQRYLYAKSLELSGDTTDAKRAPELLVLIPTAPRATFDSYLERRRREAQVQAEQDAQLDGNLPDPDRVLRDLIERLRAAAESGAAQVEVPYADTTYLLATDTLSGHATNDTELVASRRNWRRTLAASGLVLLVIIVGLLLVWRDGTTQPFKSVDESGLLVNETAAHSLAPQTLSLLDSEGNTLVHIEIVPVSRSDTNWPLPADTQAAWLVEQAAPLIICVRGEQGEESTTTTPPEANMFPLARVQPDHTLVLDDADGGQRRYRVDASADIARADLLVTMCGLANGAHTSVTAQLEAYAPAVLHPLGETAWLANGAEIVVEEVTARGPELDTSIAPGTMALDVLVATSTEAEVSAPTLRLPDGSGVPASAIQRDGDWIELRYVLPPSERARPGVLELENTRWTITIPPTPTRLTQLEQLELQVEEARWQPGSLPRLSLKLRLTNLLELPLELRTGDLTLNQYDEPLPIDGDPQASVAPGESAQLALSVEPLDQSPLVLVIGTRRWEILSAIED